MRGSGGSRKARTRAGLGSQRTGHDWRFDMSVTLACMWAGGAALALPAVLALAIPGVRRTVALAVIGGALVAAAALDGLAHLLRDRLPLSLLHLGVGCAPLLIGIVIDCAPGTTGAVAGLALFSLINLYCFVYLPWRTATWFALLSSTVCLVVIALAIRHNQLSAGISSVGTSVLAGCAAGYLRALLRRQSVTDSLTGLANRQAVPTVFDEAVAEARRDGAPLSVAIIDLDHFKSVNDGSGHGAGDQLLRAVTARWRRALQAGEHLIRYGGDEFLLVIPGSGASATARRVAELRRVGQFPCSVGVAQWDGGETLDALVARADAALCRAKRQGRDRSAVSTGPVGPAGPDGPTRAGRAGSRRRHRLPMDRLVSAMADPDHQAATMAEVLGLMCVVGGVISLPGIIFLPVAGTDVPLVLCKVLSAMAFGGGLIVVAHRLGPRFPLWAVHAGAVLTLVGIVGSDLSARGSDIAIITLNLCFWGTLFVFAFFSWPIALAYLAFGAGLLGAVIAATVRQDPFGVTVLEVGTSMIGGLVIGHLRSVLRRAAATDVLTGLPNRIALDDLLRRLFAATAKRHRPFSLAIIDLDNLKEVNDGLGHEAGDRILRAFVDQWRARLRHDDTLVRYGGDEFVAILPDCAVGAAERVLSRVVAGSEHRCSIGVAQWAPSDTVESLLSRADAALYRAKQQGRNRVVAAGQPTGPPAATPGTAPRPGLSRARRAQIRGVQAP